MTRDLRRPSPDSRRLRDGLTGTLVGLVGVVLVAWPGLTLLMVSQLAGWAMGVAGLVRASELGSEGRWRSLEFAGSSMAGLLGVALIAWPDRSLVAVSVLAGGFLITNGASRLVASINATTPRAEALANLLGLGEAMLGILIIARPVAGLRATTVLVGIGLILHGLSHMWRSARAPGRAPVTDSG
ncbi:MAG: hypothetical protein GY745_11600 [Actinomycetia bacterium]|nr:hypothetical protein [Actinomycetes bacterium]